MARIRLLTEAGNALLTKLGNYLVAESSVPGDVIDSARARGVWLCVLLDLELEDGTLHLWSGDGALVFDNDEYTGLGALIGFTPNESTTSHPASKITATLNSQHPAIRNKFLEPIGNIETTMRFVKSTDQGVSWTALPIGRKGYTSNLRQQSGTILIDLVHPFEIAFRRRPRYWSNEDARRRNSSDSGFAMMRAISEGVSIRFPYLKQQSE